MHKFTFILLLMIFILFKGCFWSSPDYYTNYESVEFKDPILTMDQYNELISQHPRPYIVEINNKLILFGASHTKNPDDPQLITLKRYWNNLKPTVALVEGRLGFLVEPFMDPVENYGEMGFVKELAGNDDVEVYSWEPPLELEVSYMLQHFNSKRIAMFYVLRPYFSNVRFGKPIDPGNYVIEFIESRTDIDGLKGTINSVKDIDSIWAADFMGYPDWRDTSDEFGLPGYLSEISAESNHFRDVHFAHVIVDLVQKDERVFAVCGSSHAVKLDKALRSVIK